MNVRIENKSPNVQFIYHDADGNFEQWYLLSNDRHHDNPKCNQKLELKHLEEAKERGAGIIDNGDLHCAMQGKYDKRSCKSDLRPEHQGVNYLDSLVETAADFYAPYASNFVCLGHGNHETAILQRHETDLTARLSEAIKARTGVEIPVAGYSGWIKFLFQRYEQRQSINLWRIHGYGGDAPVTKGTIGTARQSPYIPDAHLVLTGHTHNEFILPIARIRLSDQGKIYHDEQLHIKCPSYKEEYGVGMGGWHVERGGPPKPIGAMWLRFTWNKATRKIDYEVTRAK
jgi:hypothetical protein